MIAQIVLTPTGSKKLIAKAVARLEPVRQAAKKSHRVAWEAPRRAAMYGLTRHLRYAHFRQMASDCATCTATYKWIEDCYEGDGASLPTDGSAVKSGNCAVRGFRANSFESNQKSLRSANRAFAYSPDTRGRPYLGFRVAKTLD